MEQRCSFCRVPTNQVEKIIFGTHFNICSDCIRTCLGVLGGEDMTGWNVTTSPQRCGNCARRPSEGYRHIVNRAVYSPRVCERCIRIFTEVLLRELPTLEEELQDIIQNVFDTPDQPDESDEDKDLLEQEMLRAMTDELGQDDGDPPKSDQEIMESMREAMQQTQTRQEIDELTEPAQASEEITEVEAVPEPKPSGRLTSTLQKPFGILFDLGDTLLKHLGFDPTAGLSATLKIASNPLGYTQQDINQYLEMINQDLIPRREEAQVEFHPHIVQRHVYEALHITFDRTPEEVERVFWRAAMNWELEPGVENMLQTLQSKGIPMAIVSNAAFSGNTLWWEIEQQGLADYFCFLMSSADYWVRKPHPLILKTAAAKLKLKPSDVWCIGNAPQYDIAGALNAGMSAVWYNRLEAPLDGPDPHVEVKGWNEFLDLVEQY